MKNAQPSVSKLVAAALAAIFLSQLALCSPVRAADVITTFVLTNVMFSDGTFATGTYTYDFTRKKKVSATIYAEGATFGTSQVALGSKSFVGTIDNSVSYDFELVLATPISSTAPSAIVINPAQSYINFDTTNNPGGIQANFPVTGGTIVPASLLPMTTSSLSGTPGKLANWYWSPVTVTLTAKATANPIAYTYYTMDGGAKTIYTGPLSVSTPGAHKLVYWSVDNKGSSEYPTTIYVKVDLSPPVTTPSIANSTLTLTPTDDASGVAATYYTIDGGAQTTYTAPIFNPVLGSHTVVFWSTDNSGRVEAQNTITLVTVDTVPPTAPTNLVVTGVTASSISLGWTASTDSADGVAYYNVYETIGHSGRGGGYTTYLRGSSPTNSITIGGLAEGSSHNYTVYAFDAAGNKSGASNTVYTTSGSVPTATWSGQAGELGPYGIPGTGWGVLPPGGASAFSPMTLYVTGNPAPTCTIVGGPAGMTVDSNFNVIWPSPSGTPGTYTATVHAANSVGSSDWAFTYQILAGGTDVFAPVAPVAPTASNLIPTGCLLNWPATTDNVAVTGYRVDVYCNGLVPYPSSYYSTGNATTLTLTGMPTDGLLYVRLYAFDSAGNVSAGSPYLVQQLP